MKNRINDFMTKAPLWKIFVASCIFLFPIGLLLSGLIETMVETNPHTNINRFLVCAISLLYATLLTLSMHSCRLSDKFWSASKEFETKLENIETKEELTLLVENELPLLKNLSMGGAHVTEVNKLVAIINTKSKYLK